VSLEVEVESWGEGFVVEGICGRDEVAAGEYEHSITRIEDAGLTSRQAKHHYNVEQGLYPRLLTIAFTLIKEHCPGAQLDCLRLSIVVQTASKVRFSLDAMEQKCNSSESSYLLATSLEALSTSGLPVRSLDIFSHTRLCSIACPELSAWLGRSPATSFRAIGAHLQTLALSFSARAAIFDLKYACCSCNARKYRKQDGINICHVHKCKFEEDDDSSCAYESGLAAFLGAFPRLESLDLHEYQTEFRNGEDDCKTTAFQRIASTVLFPLLTTCVLRGVNLTENSLLVFLQIHPSLTKLTLTHVNLVEGAWTPILTHLKTMLKLQYLELEDLFEKKKVEALDGSSPPSNDNNNNNNNFIPVPMPPPSGFPAGLEALLGNSVPAQTYT
jgi:hypothetical protein